MLEGTRRDFSILSDELIVCGRFHFRRTPQSPDVGALGDDCPVPAIPIRSARPGVAVPPGRMRHDISEDRILLHTIQTAEAFGALLINGVLKPDPALAEPPLHADGYDWMYRQKAARLPTSGDGGIWLWARCHASGCCCRILATGMSSKPASTDYCAP